MSTKKKDKRKNGKIVFRLRKVIGHFFPELFDKLREIKDYRKKSEYELAELIMACVAMFMFKEGSRNAFNNDRLSDEFRDNYMNIFGLKLPHMDTVNVIMAHLAEEQLETLKVALVRELIKKKVFYDGRLLSRYYAVSIDGTHTINVEEGHCNSCLHRTSKSGRVTYFHSVLEAKLVTSNGFSISLATEWIENGEDEFAKQDCELKAFVRLSEKLKRYYPYLPMCLLCDGLYANQTFFKICMGYEWRWIVSFRDGNLPSVWEEVKGLQKIETGNELNIRIGECYQKYTWINDIDYNGYLINWLECVEEDKNEKHRFVHISDLKVNEKNVLTITSHGRMRWKIENEGFNTQKNNGYGLNHKYSRTSMQALKNYYQCLQIAHMINQLFELGSLFKPLLQPKVTIKHIWKDMLGELKGWLDMNDLQIMLKHRIQIRFG
ncbi:MAG: hypothetical protein SFH39_10995 [Candidatus Magnetobacterium sp. LHC-1]